MFCELFVLDLVFFFKQKTAYEMRISDWSSDVCSSDRLPLEKSLAPAIRIAKEGFPVYGRMVRGFAAKRKVMERYPGTREVYLPGGKPFAEGDIFRQPDLAHTLELLAEKGFDGFYRGETANKLIKGVNDEGDKWTAEELAAYKVRERAPIVFEYDGWNIHTTPPPYSGRIPLPATTPTIDPWDHAA